MPAQRRTEAERVDIRQPVQLLVEGKDAKNFLEALVDHLQLEQIQVHDFGGNQELPSFLEGFVRTSGFAGIKTLAIVRDAEDAPAKNAQQSIDGALRRVRSGLRLPWPRAEVFILPNDSDPGMLETLLCETFSGSPVDSCIEEFLQCIAPHRDGLRHGEKARARAYLVTQPLPHLSVGVAAKRGYWNLDHEVLGPLRSFLKGL